MTERLAIRTTRQETSDLADLFAAKALRQAPRNERVQKAVVEALAIGSTEPLRRISQTFADIVIRESVLGRLRTLGAVDAPPHCNIPADVGDGPTAAWVGEGNPIPLARASFSTATIQPTQLATLFAVSSELLRLSDPRAQNLLVRLASRQLVRNLDLSFVSDTAATSSQPAGILADVIGTLQASPAGLETGLEALYAAVVDGRAEAPVFIASGRGVLYLAATGLQVFRDAKLVGGSIAGAPLLVTPAAGNRLLLVDAAELATFDDGIDVQASDISAIQMADPVTPGATSVVSGFQSGFSTVRLVQLVNWLKLRDDAAGFVALDFGGSPA